MNDTPNLYRIILQVSDGQRAAEFYTKLLGIEGRDVRGSRYYFQCGPVILALLDVSATGEEAKSFPDNIYFSVSDLEAVFERAKSLDCLSTEDVHGAPAGEIVKRPWGERSFYVVDPFGNKLCFVDSTTLFTGR
jgi:predicted enzyme related to lactoylglutathione lyase